MTKRRQIILILVCWLSYTLAQLGRYSYSSNVTLIIDKFAVEHAEASLPTTLFFFAYGVGQICVGIFCHKFNRKLLVVSALMISGVINFVIFLGVEFFAIKYLWLLNGFVQANLWPVIMLILRENLPSKSLSKAGIIMAIASTGGRFAAIGLCAIFAINTEMFMYCFLTAGILLTTVALMFLFATGEIKKPEVVVANENAEKSAPKQKADRKTVILLILLGEFALANYAISGGLQSWVPSIIKESYGVSDSLSIFMSVFLPLFAVPVAFLSPYLYKKLKNYVLISLIAFSSGALLITGVLLFLDVSWIPVMILFAADSVAMGIVSNTTTVQVPLTFNGKFDAGFLAGFLNGCCYIGTAMATYVLGYIADASGWTGALTVLICLAVFSAILCLIYLIFTRKSKQVQTVQEN